MDVVDDLDVCHGCCHERGTPRNLLDAVKRLRDLPCTPDELRLTVTSIGAIQLPGLT